MFSLQRLVGGDEIFFDLLERSAGEARESVQVLIKLLNAPSASSLDDFALLRKKDKRITEEISERLTTTFVTPLEREDIEALSVALYKIPKTLEKFGERLLLC
ncbi:MAG: pit accessory protein, partial [Verrucomicrobiota bacterium]